MIACNCLQPCWVQRPRLTPLVSFSHSCPLVPPPTPPPAPPPIGLPKLPSGSPAIHSSKTHRNLVLCTDFLLVQHRGAGDPVTLQSSAAPFVAKRKGAQTDGPAGMSEIQNLDWPAVHVAGCVYVEHRPQTLQLNLQQLGHEAALGFDPVSLRGLAGHAEWGCYPTVSEVDQLLSYLNPRGKR